MDLNSRLLTLQMDVSEIFEIFLHEINKKIDERKNKEILSKVMSGIKLKFDLENFIKERFEKRTYVKSKNGREIGGSIYKIKIENNEFIKEQFDDEVLKRVRLMRSWLWENMSTQKVGDLRTMEGQDGQ